MVLKVEGRHPAEYIVSEAIGYRSRETVTIGASQDFEPGAVLGATTVSGPFAQVMTASGSNTGNGSIVMAGTPTEDGAAEGVYTLTCIAAANGGSFEVKNPSGAVIGQAAVGTAFNSVIKFTIADGSTDFAVGDSFTVTVNYTFNDVVHKLLSPAANDGTQIAAAIAMHGATTGAGETMKVAAYVCDCEVRGSDLVCPPEDVGGPEGYATFLVAIADAAHSGHGDALE